MILASAIKFHILETNEEVILCGSRHGDVFKQLKYLGFEPKEGYVEEEQGFIDQHNKFYTREEALEHAYQCGQLSSRIYYDRLDGKLAGGKKLISEDLW